MKKTSILFIIRLIILFILFVSLVGAVNEEWTSFRMVGNTTRYLKDNWGSVSIKIAEYIAVDVIESSPAVANGYVYVGSWDSKVYQLNATNISQKIAEYISGSDIGSSPTVANGYVYIGSEDFKVYQLNATNISQKIAEYSTGSSVISSPAVANGYVYVGSYDDKVYQLNATNISKKIAEYTTGGNVYSSPAVANGYVYIGSGDSKVYQLNATNISKKIAEYSTGGNVRSSPAVANGYVYVGSEDFKVYQLNATNISQKIAEYSTGGYIRSSPAVANGYVYVGSYDNKTYQLNATNISKKIAEYTTGDDIYSSPAVVNGYVYVGSYDDKVYQLNATNISKKIAEYTTGGNVLSSPAVANGYVYIGSYDSKLYQLGFSPPVWDYIPANVTIEYVTESLSIDFNASATFGIDSYFINDTTNFKIDSNGLLENNTLLVIGSYIINVSVNDTLNNINSIIYQVTVQDTTSPIWTVIPSSATLEYLTESLSVDFNATDLSGIDSYYINDTTNFKIDYNGLLENNTNLNVGVYQVLVSVNDTYNNINSTTYQVTVQDTTSPIWTVIPSSATLEYLTESLSVDFNATDLSGIDSYYVNDTTNFKIDSSTGLLENNTNLQVSIYQILVSVNDSYNNINSTIYQVTVQDTISPQITIYSPQDNVNYTTSQIDLNWSVDETTDWCAYSLDSQANDTSISYGYEYQENVTSYFCNGTWSSSKPCSNVVDANWGNPGMATPNEGFIYLNYTKPSNVIRSNTKWQVRDGPWGYGSPQTANLTFTELCWNQEPLQLLGYADYASGTGSQQKVGWYCWNSTGWYQLRYIQGYVFALFEEAMFWYVKKPSNITITVSDDYHNLTLYCNDTSGNIGQSSVSNFYVDGNAPTWDEIPSPSILEYLVDSLYVDFNASDITGIDIYYINDTSNFKIDSSTGVLENNTLLSVGVYQILVSVNDTYNHINSTIYQVTVQDTTSPIWTVIPSSATLEYLTESLSVDFNATDLSGIDTYYINDTSNFKIDSNGLLENNTNLNVGVYQILVSVNDSYNNINSTTYQVTVQDTISPTFVNNQSGVLHLTDYDGGSNPFSLLYKAYDNDWNTQATCYRGNTMYVNKTIIQASSVILQTRTYAEVGGQGWIYFDCLTDTGSWQNYNKSVSTIYYNYTLPQNCINRTDNVIALYMHSDGLNNKNCGYFEGDLSYTSTTRQNSTLEYFVDELYVQFYVTDYSSIDTFIVNDSSFKISSSGILENNTLLTIGSYDLTITVNDTSGNSNTTIHSVTVQDTIPPIWTAIPSSATLEYLSESLNVDFNASDYSLVDSYFINDTTNFKIDSSTGLLENNTNLQVVVYQILVSVNDTYNNIENTVYQVTVQDTNSPAWDYIPTNATLEYATESLSIDFNATDISGIDYYYVNDTTNFKIDSSGLLENNTLLSIGIYQVLVSVNDTSNNINSTVYQVTVQDTTNPTWYQIPGSSTLEYSVDSLYVDFNASDVSGIDSYYVNDTSNFKIDSSGILENNTLLSIGVYQVLVSVNDTQGNINSTIHQVTVQDITLPTWDFIPANATLEYYIDSLSIDFNASDVSGIDSYFINDTTNFKIDSSIGLLENNTLLSVGTYIINVSVNDTQNNINSLIYQVDVQDTIPPTIKLHNPPDLYAVFNVSINFNFTSSDYEDSSIDCNLTINSIVNQSVTVTSNVPYNITIDEFSEGIYYWNVICVDNYQNSNTSETRIFSMSVLPPYVTYHSFNVDNSTSNYTFGQFLVNITAQNNYLVKSYRANITKNSTGDLMWSYSNSSVDLLVFNYDELLDVSVWENTTYIYDNIVCDIVVCVNEKVLFNFMHPTAPVITVYEPTIYIFEGRYTLDIDFDIEASDANDETLSYNWTVNDNYRSDNEDYTYTVEAPLGDIKTVTITVTEDSPFSYSDYVTWNVTVINLGYFGSNYTLTDLSPIVIDGVGTVGASVVDWVDVLVLLGVLSIIAVISVGYYIKFKK